MSSSSRTTASTTTIEESSSDDGNLSVVAPSQDQLSQTLACSARYWDDLARKGNSTRMSHDTVRLEILLHQTPALPENLANVNLVRGYASWKLTSTKCEGYLSDRYKEDRRWLLALPWGLPTLCSISSQERFKYTDTRHNGVSLLFFGWAYILTMTLLEKQKLSMQYPDIAQGVPKRQDEPCVEINIGKTSADEWRWWSALVSPGQGWRPVGKSQPPWTITYVGNVTFRVTAEILDDIDPHVCTPPSSRRAADFLSRFASAYDLDGQSSLALAMALSLPLHSQTRSGIELPAASSFTRACSSPAPTPGIRQNFSNLSYYMSLSSNPQFLSSALWGIFWEPGIDCNLVSAWCEPILQVVSPLVQSGNVEALAHIFAHRCPNIAPLWYGVLACGRTRIFNGIVDFLKTLTLPIPSRPLAEVAAWTGSPQSFMDVCGFGPYLVGSRVSRADVWRLRHQCWNVDLDGHTFRSPPLCPWPPFGTMLETELELSVRSHLECRRHRWSYSHWTWVMDGGANVVDNGYCSNERVSVIDNILQQGPAFSGEAPPVVSKDNIASKRAIGDIFRWAASEMEPSAKQIYSHPWVDALADLNMGVEDTLGETTSTKEVYNHGDKQRIMEWIAAVDSSEL